MSKLKSKPKECSVHSENGKPTILKMGDSIPIFGHVAFDIETAPLEADHESGALLNPVTARVMAIGYHQGSTNHTCIACDRNEGEMLRQFWECFTVASNGQTKLIGFNTHGFDLPFMVRRSWGCGVKVPKNILGYGGRYWHETFVDLMAIWRLGSWKDFISLDLLSKFLGVGAKNGNGEYFHLLWDKNRKAAVDYLHNDVKLAFDCALKMGVV